MEQCSAWKGGPKMNALLIRRIKQLEEEGYTGTVTLSFHEGYVSKKIKPEVTEDTHSVEQINGDKNKRKATMGWEVEYVNYIDTRFVNQL